MTEKIIIHYEITCLESESIESIAHAIALEQTVEVPVQAIDDHKIKNDIVGQIISIHPLNQQIGRYTVSIAYQANITGYEIPQFLNVLFGNSSIKNNIKIIKLELPSIFLDKFNGPRYGIQGLRDMIGIADRPLAATALKPMGTSADLLANLAKAFALGGGDIIKDDHGLADQDFCPFEQRVAKVQQAINQANQTTGRQTLYFPNIIGSREKIDKQLDFAIQQGVKGILIAPFLVGPDTVRYIAAHYPFVIMTHPAFSGTHFHDPYHGITPSVLLGTINRLLGADIVVFPNSGGRFGFTPNDSQAIEQALQEPLGKFRSSWPAPAGGMTFENIGDMAKQFSEDTIYLIGSALLANSSDLQDSTSKMMAIIQNHFQERLVVPSAFQSTCEMTGQKTTDQLQYFLARLGSGQWQGRKTQAYKQIMHLSFNGIHRSELVGQYGEHTKFDLRYFEIKAGGFSSLEKHQHEHVIIGVEGQGVLQINDEDHVVGPHDIAYVPPFAVHQLKNNGAISFGFYCIVDHERDQPQAP